MKNEAVVNELASLYRDKMDQRSSLSISVEESRLYELVLRAKKAINILKKYCHSIGENDLVLVLNRLNDYLSDLDILMGVLDSIFSGHTTEYSIYSVFTVMWTYEDQLNIDEGNGISKNLIILYWHFLNNKDILKKNEYYTFNDTYMDEHNLNICNSILMNLKKHCI